MKKIIIVGALALLSTVKSWACGGGYEDYYYTYSVIF